MSRTTVGFLFSFHVSMNQLKTLTSVVLVLRVDKRSSDSCIGADDIFSFFFQEKS